MTPSSLLAIEPEIDLRQARAGSGMNDEPQSRQAADVLASDKRYVWHPYTQHGTEGDPIVVARAKAASLFDSSSGEILDLHLVMVDLHPRTLASEAERGARSASEPLRACHVRGLQP